MNELSKEILDDGLDEEDQLNDHDHEEAQPSLSELLEKVGPYIESMWKNQDQTQNLQKL